MVKFPLSLFIAILVSFMTGSVVLSGQEITGDKEPPLIMVLTIDGKQHLLEANSEKQIPGKFENAKFKIRTAGYRIFRNEGFSFRYPQEMEFSFEHDEDGSNKTWDFDGDDSTVSVLCLADDPANYIQASIDLIVSQTEKPEQKVEIKIGSRKANGMELTTYEYEIAWDDEYKTNMMAVELPEKDGLSRVLMFGREYENKKLVEECAALEKMVLESLQWTSKK